MSLDTEALGQIRASVNKDESLGGALNLHEAHSTRTSTALQREGWFKGDLRSSVCCPTSSFLATITTPATSSITFSRCATYCQPWQNRSSCQVPSCVDTRRVIGMAWALTSLVNKLPFESAKSASRIQSFLKRWSQNGYILFPSPPTSQTPWHASITSILQWCRTYSRLLNRTRGWSAFSQMTPMCSWCLCTGCTETRSGPQCKESGGMKPFGTSTPLVLSSAPHSCRFWECTLCTILRVQIPYHTCTARGKCLPWKHWELATSQAFTQSWANLMPPMHNAWKQDKRSSVRYMVSNRKPLSEARYHMYTKKSGKLLRWCRYHQQSKISSCTLADLSADHTHKICGPAGSTWTWHHKVWLGYQKWRSSTSNLRSAPRTLGSHGCSVMRL